MELRMFLNFVRIEWNGGKVGSEMRTPNPKLRLIVNLTKIVVVINNKVTDRPRPDIAIIYDEERRRSGESTV